MITKINNMKLIIISTILVFTFFLGLYYKAPKEDYVFKDRTDWKQWKRIHDNKPWEIEKK